MASVRQGESKIPLRMDSKLKNVSKIPLRVNQKTTLTKPKIIAEPELKRTSAINRNKKPTTEVRVVKKSNFSSQVLQERTKTVAKEVPQKHKHVELKENIKHLFEKRIPEINLLADDPFKTSTKGKQIKNSNFSSQVLQERTKTAAKEVLQKHKHAEQNENIKRLFEKRIPEIDLLADDPFKTSTKGKQIKNSNFSSQVLQERTKTAAKEVPQKSQFLKEKNNTSAKEIPQKLKPAEQKEKPLCSFKKGISKKNMLDKDSFKPCIEEKQNENTNRPSQRDIEFVADERMKKLILSNKELTPSVLKLCSNRKTSCMMDRPSLYRKCNMVPVDPFKQALADLANYRPSEGRRISEMQKNRLYLSPLKMRNSLYQHIKFVGDPYQEALKSIAELKRHQKIESSKKKVTFNLSDDDQSANSKVKEVNNGEKLLSTIQPQLNKNSEKSSGNGVPPSSKFKRNMLLTPGKNPSIKITFDSSSETDEVSEDQQTDEKGDLNQLEKKYDFFNNETNVSVPSSQAASNKEEIFHGSSPILHKQKIDKYKSIFNHEIRNSNLKTTMNPFLNSVRTSEVRQSLFSKQSEHFLDKTNPKIFTPQPVSFYPRTRLSENISPEFLSRRTTDILSCAPINTPLVLKSLCQQELSPVCKKLEFKDSPKESKKEAGDSRENSQTFYLQNIMTQQKILDQMAHQECSIFMHGAEFPCEIRENLENPIARILNNGDEMHFVPLWRLS